MRSLLAATILSAGLAAVLVPATAQAQGFDGPGYGYGRGSAFNTGRVYDRGLGGGYRGAGYGRGGYGGGRDYGHRGFGPGAVGAAVGAGIGAGLVVGGLAAGAASDVVGYTPSYDYVDTYVRPLPVSVGYGDPWAPNTVYPAPFDTTQYTVESGYYGY